MLFNIAAASLWHRKFTVGLTLLTVALSTMIILSVEHIRQEAKSSFTSTLSSTDLIVGAPGGRINLLLYSVFRIGNATNNISWDSYQHIAQQKGVRWTIPISLGDSHKGYRVLGTTSDYFTYYRYGQKQLLTFSDGNPFNDVYDIVLGAEVAKKLGYKIGDRITLSHGITTVSFSQHNDKPFVITGILNATGTPVDRTLHTSLAGIEAIHIGWKNGVPMPGLAVSASDALTKNLTPKSITTFLIGLDNKILTFRFQRSINTYSKEPLMAILPGVVLSELWQSMSIIENILRLISGLVVLTSLLGLIAMMLSTIKQRQQEITVLRATGAHPRFIFWLIQIEVALITIAGIALGLLLLWGGLFLAQPWISTHFGIYLSTHLLTLHNSVYLIAIMVGSSVLAMIPSMMAYRDSRN